ncbi:MAG: glutamate 5-kinase [Hyphomonadaceae bacterium]|nr:glutamate 5-kinase [Hyphomonadaceae bacterium]
MSPTQPIKPSPRTEWANARRIVVKIGSSLLVDHARGAINAAWLDSLAADIAALAKAGKQVAIVSSGAIALGRHVLALPRGELPLEQSQAAAAVGQISLASAYQAILKAHGLTAAQILLTLGDTEERRRYLNARQTIATLLAQRAVPVVNENDTVATTEIRYGDNDRLSARVASMMSADCLVLLSDIDGLYTAPPGSGVAARRLDEVWHITPEIEAMAGSAGTELSRGGMVTKIEAGRIALASGTNMVITSGKVMHPLRALSEGAPCTWFLAPSDPVTARKRWIAGQLEPKGVVQIDAGAEKALLTGKSLLPAGVTRVEGAFERGDAIVIRAADGRELGRGLIAYAYGDAARIIGKKSGEIAAILGHAGRTELVHRDDMVLSRAF